MASRLPNRQGILPGGEHNGRYGILPHRIGHRRHVGGICRFGRLLSMARLFDRELDGGIILPPETTADVDDDVVVDVVVIGGGRLRNVRDTLLLKWKREKRRD